MDEEDLQAIAKVQWGYDPFKTSKPVAKNDLHPNVIGSRPRQEQTNRPQPPAGDVRGTASARKTDADDQAGPSEYLNAHN